jgi:hypothetical protein
MMSRINSIVRIANVNFFFVMLLPFVSCSPVKKLKDGELRDGVYVGKEYLIRKNTIIEKNKVFDPELLNAFIRQQPNRKLFKVIPFYTWLYNSIDQEKLVKKKNERNLKYEQHNKIEANKIEALNKKRDGKRDRKNKKRARKGKLPLKQRQPKKAKLKNPDDLTFREKLQEIGEAPVILDTFLTNASTKQLKKFCENNGYFNAVVKDSIVYDPKGKNKYADIFYIIRPGKPYLIRNLNYKIEDTLLAAFIFNDTSNCKIKRGKIYQSDLLTAERERIYKTEINNGFFEFAQDYIYFLIDTNLNSNKADITIGIKKFSFKKKLTERDTLLYTNHHRFKIANIYTITDFNPYAKKVTYDTTAYSERGTTYYFLHQQKLQFRPSMLSHLITVTQNSFYNYSAAEETYKRLSDLHAFRNINIVFDTVPGKSDQLNMFVQMTPVMKQSYTAEAEGTNTAGNIGIAGSLIYQNRNIFKGAELMEIKLKGGLTAQKSFGAQNDNFDPTQANAFFNTIQFGPEFNLYFPRAFFPWPFNHVKFKPSASPKTILTSSGNYQKRPEFGRTIINLSYGYQWKLGEYNRFGVTPCEISVINVTNTSPAFQQALNASTDYFLKNSFRNHITSVGRLNYFFNNQNKPKAKNIFYLKSSFESAGNLLNPFFEYVLKQQRDANGSFTISNIPFAQFIRFETDFRYYRNLYKTNRLVIRIYGGVGYPYANMNVLPYEKGFFAGGPNSVRAWRARTLGPGGTTQNTGFQFDRIGDNQIEANLEYRFLIYKIVNGALFVDAGNVFLRKVDPLKPNGEFNFNTFYNNLGIGTGFGLRLDFSFFIIRLDASFRIHDPALPEGEKWKADIKQTIVNFGIGYPF